ncbi:UTP--glucose-1-phosphate uridylyltransferase 3, chloroplastic isoform X2 [Juglans regia]|uniref:UTP--glucose-1-phosphate uridylyltransferase 3, chloroplastic isoform X2 n=1 Tax=Juglans regia TaxID=51240 RepID=A0A6P9DV04_JUGRE|nr:UTP--glucose-1-phosphate uridylyltransferase 3, chloroplastic isoform X2 [Juglans regia]
MALNLTPITLRNQLFLFSFNSKSSPNSRLSFNSNYYHSLHLPKPLFPFSSLPSSPSSWPCHIPRVTTAPVEYAPPAPDFDFSHEITRLNILRSRLSDSTNLNDKHSVVDKDATVKQFFGTNQNDGFSTVLASLNLDSYELFLVKCLVAAGQEHVLSFESQPVQSESELARSSLKSALYALVEMIEKVDVDRVGGNGGVGKNISFALNYEEIEGIKKLLKTLGEIEQFYDCIGGIIGYQITVLELLARSCKRQATNWSQTRTESKDCQFLEIYAPSGLDLSQSTEYASQAAIWGIEAREFLYFKLYGKQCITPVAMMTSSAKNNHERITSLCERLGWFGRGRSSFKLFEQPLVPTVGAEDGQWLVAKPFTPVCKPGGHGVLWKLAYDKGIFKWFYEHGRKAATVRQVSNVVAATDLTLLALAGIGLHHGKKLGFASCERQLGATEGINVLIEKKNLDGRWTYGLSCIEYTEFDKFGITNGPLSPESLQARFPANTNILYVDLHSAELVGSSENENSLPGMVLNIKKPVVYVDHFGKQQSVSGGRLECTMQNIADSFFSTSSSRCYDRLEDNLDTFIVYNERRRVTSSAKRKRKHADKSLHQTPDGSLLDILRNACNLLSNCDIRLPEIKGNDVYVDSGPPFLLLLHPALGPLWEVTRQKFHGGSISKGSELQIEVAEFLWRNVQLDGSLIIVAEHVMGSMRIDESDEPILQYGQRCGRCKLQNVKVLNKGIDWNSGNNEYWKHDVQRLETFKVILYGNAEFEATDVVLEGNHVFEVPNGYKMKIEPGRPGLSVQLDPIEPSIMDSGSWFWNYKIKGSHIKLELVEL